jgi:hypothetical protein
MNLEFDLRKFVGTENYYKHFTGISYTDGVKYLAEHGECYWLIDVIGSYYHMTNDSRVIWVLTVEDNQGVLVGTGSEINLTQKFAYTDFPLRKIEIRQADGILFLPSED